MKIKIFVVLFLLLQTSVFALPIDDLFDSPSGRAEYEKELTRIKQRDCVVFDTPTLTKYYEVLVKSGMSKAEAWTRTMEKQDEYRAAKDKRKNITAINNLIYIEQQEKYVNNLQSQMLSASDSDTKLRLNNMIKFAYKLTEQNRALYKKDPVLYFIQRDPYMPQANINNPQYYKERFERLDFHYDKEDIMYKLRKYLTNEEMADLAKELKFYKNLSFKDKEIAWIDMNYRYGNYYGKDYLTLIINDLLKEELITKDDIKFIDYIEKYQTIKKFARSYKVHLIALLSLIFFITIGGIFYFKKGYK